MGLKTVGWEDVTRNNLAEDRDQWWIVVTGMQGFRFCKMQGLSRLTRKHGGIKTPVHTVMWEGFSTGYFNFELNCAGVY